jgi:hypothetical protein
MAMRLRALVLVFLLLPVAACQSQRASGGNAGSASPTDAGAEDPPLGTARFPTDGNGFDPANFGPDSADIDNPYFPMEPGKQFLYRGSSIDEGERVQHRVVFTVTDLTKTIAGVRTLVGWDRDFNEEGDVEEEELIFFAQDMDGTVWHLGQYAEIYDGQQLEGAAPWLVGYLEGAKAGVVMHAEPRMGVPDYSQGYAPPPYFWDDVGRVYKTGQETCVPAGCYTDVLVTEEFEPSKPGAFQLKFYAPGVGYVRVGWRGPNEEEREVLVLSEVRQLDAGAMKEVRAEAFAMEARASLYGLTQPAEQRS